MFPFSLWFVVINHLQKPKPNMHQERGTKGLSYTRNRNVLTGGWPQNSIYWSFITYKNFWKGAKTLAMLVVNNDARASSWAHKDQCTQLQGNLRRNSGHKRPSMKLTTQNWKRKQIRIQSKPRKYQYITKNEDSEANLQWIIRMSMGGNRVVNMKYQSERLTIWTL